MKIFPIHRSTSLLENVLSFPLFSQFGVNGLVLCTCAYLLSAVRRSSSYWICFWKLKILLISLDKPQRWPTQIRIFCHLFVWHVHQYCSTVVFWIQTNQHEWASTVRHFQIELAESMQKIQYNVENTCGKNTATNHYCGSWSLRSEFGNYAQGKSD